MIEVLVVAAAAVVAASAVNLFVGRRSKSSVDVLEPVRPRRRRLPTDNELREQRRTAREAKHALYGMIALSAVHARALRITDGRLPKGSGGLCRLTKWGKNHHLDGHNALTLCGQDAVDAKSVDWRRGWCAQCDDVAKAMEQLTGAFE